MPIHLVGLNHRSASLEARERLAALGTRAAQEALAAEGWGETVVLSTCNRFEVYAATALSGEGRTAGAFEGGGPRAADPCAALAGALDRFGAGPVGAYAYRRSGAGAAEHLFRVAAGLDSLVIGESEILGQVKLAYESALEAGRTGKRVNKLFQRALFVGKAVRTRTGIGAGQVSVASVAVELAKRIFGGLAGSAVLVLGAGEMAERTARHFAGERVGRLTIANRTWARARALAGALGAQTAHWDDFPAELAEADVVLAATGAREPVITPELAARALARRGGRPLFLIDIALPRAVAPEVDALDGVYRYALCDLEGVAAENLARRREELSAAEALVGAEARKFGSWLKSLGAGRELSLTHSDLRGRRSAAPAADPLIAGA